MNATKKWSVYSYRSFSLSEKKNNNKRVILLITILDGTSIRSFFSYPIFHFIGRSPIIYKTDIINILY